MKSDFLTQLLITFSLLMISISSHAAQWYHVEIIVFEQLFTVTDEQWPYMSEIEKSPINPSTNNKRMKPTAVSTLIDSKNKLSRSSKYRVHYHHAWQQPIMRKGSAKAVTIAAANGMIEGNIRLYKSTYLHASVDLWLLENKAPINNWSDISPDGENINLLVRNPHLKQSHRIRSKKLHFFDNPKLGALLQLTPIETPTSAQQSAKALESYSLPEEAAPTATE
jgi:hypothetical protein